MVKRRSIRYIYRVTALLAGAFFMLSALLKAVDPVGTLLKVEEYMRAMGFGGLTSLALPVAALLCYTEFMIGVALAAKIRMRSAVNALLLFMLAMTLVTLLNLTLLPIKDCGCFGEAFRMSNLQTFLKNLLLLAIAVFLRFWPGGESSERASIKRRASATVVVLASALEVFIFCWSLWYKPMADFGNYRRGTDLRALTEGLEGAYYDALFIYEKEGRREAFTLDNLPDSTWIFVESLVTERAPDGAALENWNAAGESADAAAEVNWSAAEEGAPDAAADFQLKNGAGEYIAGDILAEDGRVLFCVVRDAEALGIGKRERIIELAGEARGRGVHFFVVCSDFPQKMRDALETAAEGGILPDVIYTDKKTAISLNRLNGGLVMVEDGVVAYKERLTSTIW